MRILFLIVFAFIVSCGSQNSHFIEKESFVISSSESKILLARVNDEKLELLQEYWEPQRKNYCGVCSTAIAQNFLNKSRKHNQDNFFEEGVSEKVIRPELVARMGLTLREIHAANEILAKGKLSVRKNYAHLAGLDLFRKELKRNTIDSSFVMIVNFSRQSLLGEGMRWGHFSLVAAYDKKTRKVLILEVQGSRESFWVSDKDLYQAMLAIDPVSQIPRGWLSLEKELK